MVKIKKAEELSVRYKHGLSNIQIGVDDTDHLCFLCSKCKKTLEVIEVKTINGIYNGKYKENCTWIYLVCNDCELLGKRKFYWKSEDGKFCWQRTDTGRGEK